MFARDLIVSKNSFAASYCLKNHNFTRVLPLKPKKISACGGRGLIVLEIFDKSSVRGFVEEGLLLIARYYVAILVNHLF